MNTVTVFMNMLSNCIWVAKGSRSEKFLTNGPSDPRIAEAVKKCHDAGYTVNIKTI